MARVDPTSFALTGVSHYAEMVREARRQRRLVDGGLTDWVVVRNRLSTLGSRNKRLVGEGLMSWPATRFPAIDGFAERVVYREFFPRGLTALDDINEDTLGTRPNPSHVTARDEVRNLVDALKLPIDERASAAPPRAPMDRRRHQAARYPRSACRLTWARRHVRASSAAALLPVWSEHCARARRGPP